MPTVIEMSFVHVRHWKVTSRLMEEDRYLPKKVVLIRLDKIGDFISTLPMDEACRYLKISFKWVISEGLGFIAENAVPKREYKSLSAKKSWRSFWQLLAFLKAEKPALTVVFYAPWWASFACWWAGVPIRAGRKSQWHSFLFLNKTLRQSRSQSEMHEADYNWDLMRFALGYRWFKDFAQTPILQLTAPASENLLKQWQLDSGDYVVVHAGMAGSALNWTEANYHILIEKLVAQSPVVFTGTAEDELWLAPLRKRWKSSASSLAAK